MTNAIKKRLCNPAWWLSQLKTLLVVVVVVGAVSLYQQRNMVSGYAPELIAATLADERFNLAEHHAQGPVMVYFWGSWCGICSLTSPAVSDLAVSVTGTGSSVVTVALASGDNQEVQAFQDQHRYRFTTLNDDNGAISQRWGVGITPSFFYINPKGEIVFISTGLSSGWGMRIKLWLARYL
jgi:peroxiredoxin